MPKYFAAQAMEMIAAQFGDCPDLIRQKTVLSKGREAFLIYFEGQYDTTFWNQEMKRQILALASQKVKDAEVFGLPSAQLRICSDYSEVTTALVAGEIMLLTETLPYGIAISLKKPGMRAEIPDRVETSLYGPAESFSSQLHHNLALIRSKIASPRLKFKMFKSGTETEPRVAIAYLDEVTDFKLVKELEQRIQVLHEKKGSNRRQMALRLAISDCRYSPFPQYQITQRIDMVVKALQDGRIAVFEAGTAIALVAPINFYAFFEAPDDRQNHPFYASLMRSVRVIVAMANVLLPGLYVAVTSYHYSFLNLKLLNALALSRSNALLLPVFEVLLMEILLLILSEFALRLASPTGVLIGIVTGLLLAGVLLLNGWVSSMVLLISALTLTGFFLLPPYHVGTLRILRIILIALAGGLGVLGIALGASLTYAHLIALKSLGQPYLRPLKATRLRDKLKAVFQ